MLLSAKPADPGRNLVHRPCSGHASVGDTVSQPGYRPAWALGPLLAGECYRRGLPEVRMAFLLNCWCFVCFVLQQWCVGGKSCAVPGGAGGGRVFVDFLAARFRRLALVRVRWVSYRQTAVYSLFHYLSLGRVCEGLGGNIKRDENQLLRVVAPPNPPHMMGAVGSVVRLLARLRLPPTHSSTNSVTQGAACALTNE